MSEEHFAFWERLTFSEKCADLDERASRHAAAFPLVPIVGFQKSVLGLGLDICLESQKTPSPSSWHGV
jgi:hypothetical protein